jgi:lipase
MVLKTRHWGSADPACVVCVHGLTQHGGVFEEMGRRLAAAGHFVVAVDLRGHGESGAEPPWSESAHVGDLLETIDDLGLERVSWVGHSFGGRLAAAVAARAPRRTRRLALLEPGLQVPPARALRAAETERLDWSFATREGAIQAILSSPTTVAAPREIVAAYVEDDLRRGPDGRLRFRCSPAAAVVAWSEMTLPAPPVTACPTLFMRAADSLVDPAQLARYERELGELLTVVEVGDGHNLLWESPEQTAAAVERLLAEAPADAGRA